MVYKIKMNSSLLYYHNRYFLFFAFTGLFFGLIVSHSIYPVALYSSLIALCFVLFLSFYQFTVKIKSVQFLFLLMVTSFIVKIISVFIFERLMIDIVGIPFLSYNDDYVYDLTSSNILDNWNIRGIGFYSDIQFSTGFYSGYPNISALAKLLFGDHYLVPRFLNAFFSTLTIPFYYFTVKYLSSNKNIVRVTTILLSFSPAFITYSSLQLKDTILIFFVATLLYGTIQFFSKGVNAKNIIVVALSMAALLFFRAAILLPYIISLILAITVAKEKYSNNNSWSLKSFLWIALVLSFFYIFWGYLYSSGVLALTGEEYFESRFSSRDGSDTYQGTNDIGKLGIIAVLLGPLLALLSLFLPAPVYIQLDEFSSTVPSHYLPLLGYYAILPMVCTCLFYLVKNYRINKIGLFLITFLILYKLGQAGSKSILDSRQSLPAIYVAYLLLAYFDLKQKDINILWKRYRLLIVLMLLVVMFSVTFLRYTIRL